MSGQRIMRASEILTFIPPRGSNARTEIRRLREQYKLSWSDLARYMEYSKSSVMHYWTAPEKAGQEFWIHFQIAVSSLKQERGLVHEVVVTSRLPRRFGILGKGRRCLGHREYWFQLPENGYCSLECEKLDKMRQEKVRVLHKALHKKTSRRAA